MLNLYAMRDVCIGFMNPTVFSSDAEALRAFKLSVENGQVSFPDDMELFKLGEYDDKTGIIAPSVSFVAKARDFVVKTSSSDLSESGDDFDESL